MGVSFFYWFDFCCFWNEKLSCVYLIFLRLHARSKIQNIPLFVLILRVLKCLYRNDVHICSYKKVSNKLELCLNYHLVKILLVEKNLLKSILRSSCAKCGETWWIRTLDKILKSNEECCSNAYKMRNNNHL